MRDERGQPWRTRGAIGGDAQCGAHVALVGFIALHYRFHGWTSPAHLLGAASNETGALRDGALRDAVPRHPITRRCRGRRPGRTRRTGSCSNDRSRHADARRHARPPPTHRWRTSSRHPGLHTLRTSAPLSVPSPDHPFWISRPRAGGEVIDANPPPAPVQLLRAATMPRKDTSAPTTKITTAR